MTPSHRAPLFFVHLMKTGGTTFVGHMRANYRAEQLYPDGAQDTDLMAATTRIAYLLGLPEARRQQLRAYSGHFPYYVTDLLGFEPIRLTMLRDPVDRALSRLKHAATMSPQHKGKPLEEIYEDGMFYRWFIHNHQCKVFSLRAEDAAVTYLHYVEIDDERFNAAVANLEAVDFVGITERSAEFLADVSSELGWTNRQIPDQNVSGGEWGISDSFRRRIASDNAADMAFYDVARSLFVKQRAARSATTP